MEFVNILISELCFQLKEKQDLFNTRKLGQVHGFGNTMYYMFFSSDLPAVTLIHVIPVFSRML